MRIARSEGACDAVISATGSADTSRFAMRVAKHSELTERIVAGSIAARVPSLNRVYLPAV